MSSFFFEKELWLLICFDGESFVKNVSIKESLWRVPGVDRKPYISKTLKSYKIFLGNCNIFSLTTKNKKSLVIFALQTQCRKQAEIHARQSKIHTPSHQPQSAVPTWG